MNQTQAPDDAAHNQPQRGPRVTRDQIFDIGRLRRSSSDKYVGGVAGGLGRHLDIDPLIVRVVFAVTALFGVGILLYVAFWLLLPDDADHAPISTEPETRKVLVLVAVGIAAVMLLGVLVGDSSGGIFWIALLALGGLAVYAMLRKQPTGPYRDVPVDPAADPAADLATDAATPAVAAEAHPAGPNGPTYAAAMYTPPPRSRRTGMILFWPTLALLAIAMGSLAMYDLNHVVAEGAYPALAIGLIGMMLVIGAFTGRAGGLILLGLLAIPPLVITSTLGNDFTRGGSNQNLAPTSAALVENHYAIGSGRLELDLTRLSPDELSKLNGRQIAIDMKAGEVTVSLPPGVGYEVKAELSLAGEIMVDDRAVSGLNPNLSQSNTGASGADALQPSISFDIEGAAGRIAVQTIPVDQGVKP